jgi:hypothetical protein
MIVEFWTRQPGNYFKIAEGEWSAVPRQGETVHVDERAYVVHEVTWNFEVRGRMTTEVSARVLLR